MMPHSALSRRMMLKTTACGFGYLALAHLATVDAARAATARGSYVSPLAPKQPHFAPRANRVIFLFMQGGPSHLDTFDYKPALLRDDGKNRLLRPAFAFRRRGESGLWMSDLFPQLARHADDLCMLHGMHTDNAAHPQATIALHTGNFQFVRPSVGSWVLYGLGTPNQDLPGYITIAPPLGLGGAQNYGAAFLPAAYQGTPLGRGPSGSVANIANPSLSSSSQQRQLQLVESMNRDLVNRLGPSPEIEGVIQSYELAFRMQAAVPDVMDIRSESAATLQAYGIGSGNDRFARQCLMARRFAEAGVRYIEVCHPGWDQHNNLKSRMEVNARQTDQPIAALLDDLKQRGLLDDTLVIWGGEFGRTPTGQGRDGRNHNSRGYTMWLAGGGAKPGFAYGATDEHGATAVDGRLHTHDLHATLLHLMGLDHERLTYRYSGRDFRLTDVAGRVATPILA